MSKVLIRLQDLTMEFDGERILDGINLYFNDHEFLTLLGPSGCGKSTTLRIIGGFLTPTSGKVFFDGKVINDVPPYKRQVNTVFQRYALFPHLDVYDNIAFGLKVAKLPKDEIDRRVHEMLEIVSLKGYENLKDRQSAGYDLREIPDDGKKYVENVTSLFAIPLMFYCTLPNSGRYLSEINAMVDAVVDVFREEYSKWEKAEDVKFVLCTRLTDELNLLKRNYKYYKEYLRAPEANENPVIDIIQRKIRDVILSAPEPEDYEALLDKVAKEFNNA